MPTNDEKLDELRKRKDLKVGQGFSEARGYIEEDSKVPKKAGMNVNNDPAVAREKAKAKKEYK